jgi:uncharacterized protein YceH (UPF0502 family)
MNTEEFHEEDPAQQETAEQDPAEDETCEPAALEAGLPFRLNPAQARVLGALMEKEATTPDYYPLSLNALVNACNQRSNREPVMDLDEEEVHLALRNLEEKRLAGRARGAEGRVAKYEHWLGEAFNFTRAETALICVLLLRGPQTPGELRGRTERLHAFDEIGDVLGGLQKLMDRSPALAAVLPRQPGTKEARYTHLLSGPVAGGSATLFAPVQQRSVAAPANYAPAYFAPVGSVDAGAEERIARLEAAVAELRQQMADLSAKFDDLFGD